MKAGDSLVIPGGLVVVVGRVDLYRDGGIVAFWPGGSMYREPRVRGGVRGRSDMRPRRREFAGAA